MRFRLLTPIAVAAALAAVAAFVQGGGSAPALPRISVLALASQVSSVKALRFSGTVALSVDIGLPKLPKLAVSGGADPVRLLSGVHYLQVAADTTGGVERQRVAFLETFSEYDAVRNGFDLWIWDSTRQLARHGSVGALASALLAFATPGELLKSFTGPEAVKTVLFDTGLASGLTTRVAGRDAYLLQAQPRAAGSTIGEIRIAVDAATGMPLSVAVYPVGSSTAAIKAEFTSLSFATSDRALTFRPPPGATVVEEHAPQVTVKPYRGAGSGWTAAVEVPNFDARAVVQGLGKAPGDANPDQGAPDSGGSASSGPAGVFAALAGTPGTPLQSYLRMMLSAGTPSPAGMVYSSRLISAVFTPDHRFYLAFTTPETLIKTVEADSAGH